MHIMEYFFFSSDAIAKVNMLFSLPATGSEQDWEIELADPARTGEFFNALESNLALGDKDVEAAIAALLISSADEAISSNTFPVDLDRKIKIFFRNNLELSSNMNHFFFHQGSAPINSIIRSWLEQ